MTHTASRAARGCRDPRRRATLQRSLDLAAPAAGTTSTVRTPWHGEGSHQQRSKRIGAGDECGSMRRQRRAEAEVSVARWPRQRRAVLPARAQREIVDRPGRHEIRRGLCHGKPVPAAPCIDRASSSGSASIVARRSRGSATSGPPSSPTASAPSSRPLPSVMPSDDPATSRTRRHGSMWLRARPLDLHARQRLLDGVSGRLDAAARHRRACRWTRLGGDS